MSAMKWDWRKSGNRLGLLFVLMLGIAASAFAQSADDGRVKNAAFALETRRVLEREDVHSVVLAARDFGLEIDEPGAQLSTDGEGMMLPFKTTAMLGDAATAGTVRNNAAPTERVAQGHLYYHANAAGSGKPLLVVGLISRDAVGRSYFELQIPGGGVRFTSVGTEFEVTEVEELSDGSNIATNVAGQITTLAWDFGAIKHCFLSWLGIDNLSQLSGKIDAFCTLSQRTKDVLTIATHGSSCLSVGVLSCAYFGLYLTKFLTCGAADIISCVNGNPPTAPDGTLTIGQPLTNQTVAKGQWRYYSLNVPSGQPSLTVAISGSGDADLYTRSGSKPTSSSYLCRPYVGGSNETCLHLNPAAGQWWVGIYGFANATVTISATTGSSSSGDVQLTNNQPLSGQTVQQGQWKYYYINVPSGRSLLEVSISGSGDADLYTRLNAKPTASSYLCRPYAGGSGETCIHNSPAAGQWWVGVYGYSSATVTVKARYQ